MKKLLFLPGTLLLLIAGTSQSCKKELREYSNQQPVADAGHDVTITLPVDSLQLDGRASKDPDGSIKEFSWSRVSGPSSFRFFNPQSATTVISDLVQGIYQIELKVTDDGGLSAKDTLMVTVGPASAEDQNACHIETRPEIQARLVPIGGLSVGRVNIVTAATDNKILFVGGISYRVDSTGIPMRRIDIYDINNNSWSVKDLPEDPTWRADMGIATIDNKVLIAGGGFWGDDIYTNRVDIYNGSEDSWSIASLTESRSATAGINASNKVFFAGGYGWFNGPRWSNTVDIFDNSTKVWTTAVLSEPRGFISAVAAGNKIYFAGGQINDGQIRPSDRIDEYDLLTNSWSTSSLNEPRANMAVISAGNKVFFAGGYTSSGESGTVEIRDITTGITSLACIIPRGGLNAVLKDDKVVFFTGYGSDPRNGNHFEIYDLTTNTWYTAVLDKSITFAAIISVDTVIYVAGGFVNGAGSDQVWKLEF